MAWYTGLYVEVSEAKGLESGRLLLGGNSLNPFCCVSIDNAKICRTDTKYHTAAPLWGEEFYFHCPQKGFHFLTFTVTHDDTLSRKIGRLMLSWEQIRAGPLNGWFPLSEVSKEDEVQGEVYVAVAKFPDREGGRLRVLVSEAKDLAAKDTGGSCDPYCQVTFNGLTFKTRKMDKTRFPVWAETFDFPMEPQISFQPQPSHPFHSSLSVTVFDKDFREDEFMGEVGIPFSEINSMETAHGRWYSLLPRTKDRIEQEALGSLRIKVSPVRQYVMSTEVYSPLRQVMTEAVCDQFNPHFFKLFSDSSTLSLARTALNLTAFYLSADHTLAYLHRVCDTELSELKDSNTLFRANTLASKSLDHLLKLTSIPYLKSTLQASIINVILEDRNCELDPNRLMNQSDYKRKSVFLESPSAPAVDQLTSYLTRLMDRILSSEKKCPLVVRRALKQLFQLTSQHFPEATQDKLPFLAVSGFLFLRFFAASILSPKLFSLCDTYPNERTSRTLTLLAKLVQCIANLTRGNESYLRPFDEILDLYHVQVKAFIRRFVDVPDEERSIFGPRLFKQMSFEGCVIISGALQKCKLTNIKYFLGSIQTAINFKKRYFELTSNLLSYYSDSSSHELKGNIPVPYITYVEQLDSEAIGSKYTLQLRVQSPHEGEPMYFFMIAPSLNDMRAWLSALSKCCLYNRSQTPLFHPGFFKRASWSCCRNKEKTSLGCKGTRQSVILGDWQDPLDQNFELQVIYSQLQPIRDKMPTFLTPTPQSLNPISQPEPDLNSHSPLESDTLSHIPVSLSITTDPCPRLFAAIDSVSTAREDSREFHAS